MAHVAATIPWEEGQEEDLKDLRKGLEKQRSGDNIVNDSSDSEVEGEEYEVKEYHRYEESDSDNVDDPEEDVDPGPDQPGESLLWSGGADPLGATDSGWTALHSAARWNCVPCVETLLHLTPVNCTTHGGQTPLHLACQSNHRQPVKLLLSHPDITVDMVNSQGDTPRQVAERVGSLGPLFDAVMPVGVMSHKE
eukprot:GFUD01110565.1.p1 GENE.GFUD01110565.1~~GFUD01110565.1.p1  ORF type:complete len:194 (+),score=72.65 GFUD01110565.1:53-634(+)